ncbi:MAG: hypothetical protein ACPGNT_09935, partial [Rhodospirillales bacterium]
RPIVLSAALLAPVFAADPAQAEWREFSIPDIASSIDWGTAQDLHLSLPDGWEAHGAPAVEGASVGRFFPKAQSFADWTDQITVQTRNVPEEYRGSGRASAIIGHWQRSCGQFHLSNTLMGEGDDLEVIRFTIDCEQPQPGAIDLHTELRPHLIRTVQIMTGRHVVYEISRDWQGDTPEAASSSRDAEWTAFFDAIRVIKRAAKKP